MKLIVAVPKFALTLGPLCCLLAMLAGCAAMDSGNQESLLSAAGFVERTPQTPKQRELYAAASSYLVERFEFNGKAFYGYKDEKRGIAYVGGEAAYQRYKELAIRQQIAQQNYQAAEMNQETARAWYGAYGPYVFGPRVVVVRHR